MAASANLGGPFIGRVPKIAFKRAVVRAPLKVFEIDIRQVFS